MSSIDIASTIYAICEIEKPTALKGVNALDKQQREAREMVFAETYAHDFTSIDSSLYYSVAIDWPYKLILPDPNNKPEENAELFNVKEDAREEVALDNREFLDRLSKEIASHRASY